MARYYHSPGMFVDNLVKGSMGQYFKVFNLDKKEIVKPDWLKLMEHSYINNESVSSVEMLLVEGGRWHKDRIVWGGDYGEMELWSVLYEDKAADWTELKSLIEVIPDKYRYVVNYDTKEYVDKQNTTPEFTQYSNGETQEISIHPMPLLLADGNGGGGGDYHGSDMNLVGSWKGNRIGILEEVPENFTKLNYRFKRAGSYVDH